MFTRRDFLRRTLAGSSLVALGGTVPGFLARTAHAAEPGKDKILVVIELEGGNDGLNTVVPFADDLYHKARPTLRLANDQLVALNEHLGLHAALSPLKEMYDQGQLAVLQGIGYPNPNRSHFESMDIWQSADPTRRVVNGWLGRSVSLLKTPPGRIPAFHVAEGSLPLALSGSSAGIPTIHPNRPLRLRLVPDDARPPEYVIDPDSGDGARPQPADDLRHRTERMDLIRGLANRSAEGPGGLADFVRRTSLDTYTTLDRLAEIIRDKGEFDDDQRYYGGDGTLYRELSLVGRMIRNEFGARVYYVSLGSFDTHGSQREDHDGLLRQLSFGVQNFFEELAATGDDQRVLLLTFSEFGRRVKENGSRGTDHGAASCMFAVGPKVRGGIVGEHPSLADLDSGDLKHHTDFRQVYATVLDKWLEVDSRRVLGDAFQHVPILA